jgi:hypothetical protein
LDNNGNVVWQKLLGGNVNDYAISGQQTIDGGFIVAGYSNSSNTGTLTGLTNNGSEDYWILKLDDSGNITWQKLLGGSAGDFCNSIQQTSDRSFIVAGYALSSNTGTLIGITSNGSQDYWIIRLDESGVIVWQKLLGGSGGDFAHSIYPLSGGSLIIAGETNSSNTGTLSGLINNGLTDYWILKLDGGGNPY